MLIKYFKGINYFKRNCEEVERAFYYQRPFIRENVKNIQNNNLYNTVQYVHNA